MRLSSNPFAVNRDFYASERVVNYYANNNDLHEAERKILERYAAAIGRAELLDVGVGAGRTVPHLRARCASYTGIDYAQPMIDRCRERFPDARLLCCDARDLAPFADTSFDVVYASFNGLDELLPEDRIRALREVARVLRPEGLFLFSSHNVGWRNDVYSDPVIVMEKMMNVELPTYYIGPAKQIEQLASVGLTTVEVAGADGEVLADPTGATDPWLHYVTRMRTTSRLSSAQLNL